MKVEALVPWRGGCAHRERAWGWVRACHREAGRSVREAPAPPGPWIKAAAIMPALEESDAEVVVLADADVWSEGIPSAVRAIVCGAAEWAVPHRRVLRLSKASTAELLGTGRAGAELARRPYEGRLGGGMVVARRDTLLSVPMDRRFVGWGGEDDAFGCALSTLLGHPWRGNADLIHLWHPLQPRLNEKVGSKESWQLYRRYLRANGKPDEMRQLIAEEA